MYGAMMHGPMGPMMARGWDHMWSMPLYVTVAVVAMMTVTLALAVFGVVFAVRRDRALAGKAV